MKLNNFELLHEHLKKVDGKWALVSKTTGKVLRYYHGEGKPSQAWKSKMEQQIHAFESLNESIEFNKDKLPNGRDIVRFHDVMGGEGFLTIDGDIANIVDWNSIPMNKRLGDEAGQFKQRGFAVEVVKAIRQQLGIPKIRITLQNQDAIRSLNKMVDKGILTPDQESRMGSSDNRYYTTFTINESQSMK